MSKKEQFNDGEIEDLFSKVEIPLEKDKNHIWSEKFESLVKEDVALSSKKTSFFRLYWHYGVAASFAILLASTLYFYSQNTLTNVVAYLLYSTPRYNHDFVYYSI